MPSSIAGARSTSNRSPMETQRAGSSPSRRAVSSNGSGEGLPESVSSRPTRTEKRDRDAEAVEALLADESRVIGHQGRA